MLRVACDVLCSRAPFLPTPKPSSVPSFTFGMHMDVRGTVLGATGDKQATGISRGAFDVLCCGCFCVLWCLASGVVASVLVELLEGTLTKMST